MALVGMAAGALGTAGALIGQEIFASDSTVPSDVAPAPATPESSAASSTIPPRKDAAKGLEVCDDTGGKIQKALALANSSICRTMATSGVCEARGPFPDKFSEVRSDYPGSQSGFTLDLRRVSEKGYLCSENTKHEGQDVLGFTTSQTDVKVGNKGWGLGVDFTQTDQPQIALTPAFFEDRFNDCDRATALAALETCESTGECSTYRGHLRTLTPGGTAGAVAEAMYTTCSESQRYPEALEAAGMLTANQVANGYSGHGKFEYTSGPYKSYDGYWSDGEFSGPGTLVLRNEETLKGEFFLGGANDSSDLTYTRLGYATQHLESYCDGDKGDDKKGDCKGWYVITVPKKNWDDYTWNWSNKTLDVEHKSM